MADSPALSGAHRDLLSRTFAVALDLAHAVRGIDDQTGDAAAARAFVESKESRRELERLLGRAAGLMGELPPDLSRAIACLSAAILQPRRNGNSSFADAARALAAAGLDGPARDGMGHLQASDPRSDAAIDRAAALAPYFSLIAVGAEIAWNLREWMREAHERPNLKPVLQARLPHLRSRLELELVHSHMAANAAELPSGDELTAATLIGFIEGLRLPNGTKIKIPAGEPPSKWPTLSRMRAKQIAMQVVGENNELLFDPENQEDLNEIEAMGGDELAEHWQAVEAHNQTPIGAPLPVTTETVGGGEPTPVLPTGFLGGADLADAMNVHATRRDAFLRQLERQRISLGDDCWHEVREPRPNSPKFLYRADSQKLRALAAKYETPKPA